MGFRFIIRFWFILRESADSYAMTAVEWMGIYQPKKEKGGGTLKMSHG